MSTLFQRSVHLLMSIDQFRIDHLVGSDPGDSILERGLFSLSELSVDCTVNYLLDREPMQYWDEVAGGRTHYLKIAPSDCTLAHTGWAEFGSAVINLERCRKDCRVKEPFDHISIRMPEADYELTWKRLPIYFAAMQARQLRLSIECEPYGFDQDHKPTRFNPSDKRLGLVFRAVRFSIGPP